MSCQKVAKKKKREGGIFIQKKKKKRRRKSVDGTSLSPSSHICLRVKEKKKNKKGRERKYSVVDWKKPKIWEKRREGRNALNTTMSSQYWRKCSNGSKMEKTVLNKKGGKIL